jgi:hydroxymethylpyrimidine/phosphomethylpyrimidine kinase
MSIKGNYVVLTDPKGSELVPKPVDGISLVVAVFYDGKEFKDIGTKYVNSKSTHGAGCTLACK